MIEIILTIFIIWLAFNDLLKEEWQDFKNGTGLWVIINGHHYIRRCR
jgi:hypothetical protein